MTKQGTAFLTGIALTVAATAALGCLATPSPEPPAPTDSVVIEVNLPTYTLPPCESEDQDTNCYWDASEMGNGMGEDFIVLNGKVFR